MFKFYTSKIVWRCAVIKDLEITRYPISGTWDERHGMFPSNLNRLRCGQRIAPTPSQLCNSRCEVKIFVCALKIQVSLTEHEKLPKEGICSAQNRWCMTDDDFMLTSASPRFARVLGTELSRLLHNPVRKQHKQSKIVLWHISALYDRGTVSAGKFEHVAWTNPQQETRWQASCVEKPAGRPKKGVGSCLSLCTPRACSQTQKNEDAIVACPPPALKRKGR